MEGHVDEKRNVWVNLVWKAFEKHLLAGPKTSWKDNIKPHVKEMCCECKIIRKYRPIFNKVILLGYCRHKVAYMLNFKEKVLPRA
jgi:hypothetical protein